jgi:parvulin-like peptidyl-prolyl isomerase
MRIIRTAFFCVLMIVISGCLAGEAPEPAAEDEAASQEEPQDINSVVLVSLGEKALTMGQVKWMVPDGDPKKIASFTKMWLETELLYEQAQRQGLTEDKKEAFLADMAMKRSFVRVMVNSKFQNVEVTDEEVRDYYEKNKFEDLQLYTPAIFSISHIRVGTLREAENTLKFVKGGEDFNELAKKVSIADDAQRGGRYKGAAKAVEQRYGKEFLEALEKAQTGQVIGPVQVEGGFEIARMEQYTEASARPFERAKGRIKTNLLKERRKAAFDNFINELKEKTKYKIEKSEALLEMEKEAESQTAPPSPGR